MHDIGILLVKHPTDAEEITALEGLIHYQLRKGKFKILEQNNVDIYAVTPLIYVDARGNPLPFAERDIESRKKLYGERQTGIAYIVQNKRWRTLERLDALVGPTSFEEYEKPEYKNTLRAILSGPKVVETLEDGTTKEVRIDFVHCTRTFAELKRDIKILFGPEVRRKYDFK